MPRDLGQTCVICKAEGTKMRKVTFATIATAGLAAATFGLASPALAATGTAQDTINSLEAQGFTVFVHKVGNAPLSQCSVSGVKPGHTTSRTDSGVAGGRDRPIERVESKTINVFVSC